MLEDTPSRTAQGVAFLRAVHQVLDAPPLILTDPVALALFGPTAGEAILAAPERYQDPVLQVLRSLVVLRSRYTEDRLAAAVARGTEQLVVLGAGFDTFAYRQPEWAAALRIFEVDQAATQQTKRERLALAAIAVPENVSFVAVDFERESLRQALERGGVRADRPTFFSWLGVTMYLREEAIDAVLATVASFAAGSEIVLTFAQPRTVGEGARGQRQIAELAAEGGEPWISFFAPDEIERKLRSAGYSDVEFLTPVDASARYFAGRPADIPPPRRTTIVSATV